ncbi:type II toxin-antitoxin system HicB family antitoxin [Vibrio sp. 665]|uniref:type II toxin-antitoxin system HicB family antitoxin n=1 Tax=Vibrio TaxID=662 RepID=UPI002160CF43|nr:MULTISPECIES: type II toxin-antitoxin system HicB family antitoxin [Vibrio]MCS0251328.1 type II toxin-antitoxin system HicB family antitoxin [Vibrio alginolyticus]MDW2031245.1 type II toxin-antitoxin system HicB family antitoxin [Vibrio sp. 665]
MNSFDPEFYSISVRKEVFEDELVYVARIQEFPDVLEFAGSYEEARELALDTLITSYELLTEQGITFPEPMAAPQDAASGRITLRMPKTLHARLIEMAQREEVSLNQYIVSNLSMSYGQCSIVEKISSQILEGFAQISHRVGVLNNKVTMATANHLLQSEFGANMMSSTSWGSDSRHQYQRAHVVPTKHLLVQD